MQGTHIFMTMYGQTVIICNGSFLLSRICQQVNACNRTLAREVREMNCDDCRRNMGNVRDHLTGRDHVTGNKIII